VGDIPDVKNRRWSGERKHFVNERAFRCVGRHFVVVDITANRDNREIERSEGIAAWGGLFTHNYGETFATRHEER